MVVTSNKNCTVASKITHHGSHVCFGQETDLEVTVCVSGRLTSIQIRDVIESQTGRVVEGISRVRTPCDCRSSHIKCKVYFQGW